MPASPSSDGSGACSPTTVGTATVEHVQPMAAPSMAAPSMALVATVLRDQSRAPVTLPASGVSGEERHLQQLMEIKAAQPSAATTNTSRARASVPSLTIVFLLLVATCAARPKCLLHVGPHKTGTTTLQWALYTHANLLRQDGWHQPSKDQFSRLKFSGKNLGHKQFANVAFFLQQDRPNASVSVWQRFQGWISARVRANESIVLSSEELDRSSVNRSLLASVLAPFKTTVVIGYRIFFDWILSLYRQGLSWLKQHLPAAEKNMTLSRWLSLRNMSEGGNDTMSESGDDSHVVFGNTYFTDDLMRAYARHFDDIRVLPLSPEMVTTLVCSFIGANRTCASLLKTQTQMKNVKASPPPPPAAPGLDAGVCASQGGCLDREIRAMLLTRAYHSATAIATLAHLPQLVPNRTEMNIRLDALGLCFC